MIPRPRASHDDTAVEERLHPVERRLGHERIEVDAGRQATPHLDPTGVDASIVVPLRVRSLLASSIAWSILCTHHPSHKAFERKLDEGNRLYRTQLESTYDPCECRHRRRPPLAASQLRPSVDRAKPAICRHFKTGHFA
jgi:hypothetical protein